MALRIYTRTGDDGTTGLFGGERVSKAGVRVEAYGTVDELNAHLGVSAAACADQGLCELLQSIQNDLFLIGSDLSTPEGQAEVRGVTRIERLSSEPVMRLEASIDLLESQLKPLTAFILPGGCGLAAQLHVARTVCRRAERRVIALAETDTTNPETIRYLNRLSDLLFVMGRVANARAGKADILWRVCGTASVDKEKTS